MGWGCISGSNNNRENLIRQMRSLGANNNDLQMINSIMVLSTIRAMGMILVTLMSMEMGMESNEASNKNAQTPKWEWGDGGGRHHGTIISILLYFTSSNSSSASSSVPVSSFLLYGTTTDTTNTNTTTTTTASARESGEVESAESALRNDKR